MDWRNIPSLSALRAFESAARLSSFSAAARELNVTHAAIAQHVRALEAEFNQSLLVRQGRKMELTQAGRALSISLTDGFSIIEHGVNDLADHGKTRPIAVSVTPSFAENWLLPRLGEFWAKHPEIQLNILPTSDLVSFRRDNIDLAIRYGKGEWPNTKATRLTSTTYVAIGASDLVGKNSVKNIQDLNNYTWLAQNPHNAHDAWAKLLGLKINNENVKHFASGTLVVNAVRACLGVAVVSRALVEQDIAKGKLTILYQAEMEDFAYYIVTPPVEMTHKLKTFIKWLLDNV